MIDFFDDTAAIRVVYKHIRADHLANAKRQQKHHVKCAPCQRAHIEILYHIHAEIAEYGGSQHLGQGIRQVGAALILRRRFPEIKRVLRALAVTGQRRGRKRRNLRLMRPFYSVFLLSGKTFKRVRERCSLLVKILVVGKSCARENLCALTLQRLRVALCTPQLQAVDLRRNIIHSFGVCQARGFHILAALALQNALQL